MEAAYSPKTFLLFHYFAWLNMQSNNAIANESSTQEVRQDNYVQSVNSLHVKADDLEKSTGSLYFSDSQFIRLSIIRDDCDIVT